ncbi:hypothetical protein [Bacillus sp. FSL K6-3431]
MIANQETLKLSPLMAIYDIVVAIWQSTKDTMENGINERKERILE